MGEHYLVILLFTFVYCLFLYWALVTALICSKTFGNDLLTVYDFSISQFFHDWVVISTLSTWASFNHSIVELFRQQDGIG